MFIIHTKIKNHNIPNNYVTSIQTEQVIMDFPSLNTPIQLLKEGIVSLTYDRGATEPVKKAHAVGARLYLDV